VLKSRRGLLAAGLAVAVVGTIGVASTINAGAEEIAEPSAAAPAVVEPSAAVEQSAASTGPADVTAPPKLDLNAKTPSVLPWGSRPQRIKKGRPGLSSKALRGTGADVAPADASGSLVPKGRSGPKGRTTSTSFVRSEALPAAPPEPAPAPTASVAPVPTASPEPEECPTEKKPVCYLYNVGMQEADTEGAYATMWIGKPKVTENDFHSLAEIAVQSKDEKQIVEIGWHVDPGLNKDADPHLFVYHWVNKETSCYNGCGFVQVSKNIKPGDTLVDGVAKKFGIQFVDNKWWVAYDSEWVGYFPETLWTKRGIEFNRTGYVQFFGEIAAADDLTCTQMGNGKLPNGETEKESAYLAGIGFLDGPPVSLFIYSSYFGYDVKPLNVNRSLRYGGPTVRVKNALKCPEDPPAPQS
jgi:hypothetical protein